MTKPIEETWIQTLDCCLRLKDQTATIAWFAEENRNDGDVDVERSRLAVCAPEALRLLLKAELYATKHGNTACCPWCGGGEPYHGDKHQHATHTEGCAWLRIMRKAGLR